MNPSHKQLLNTGTQETGARRIGRGFDRSFVRLVMRGDTRKVNIVFCWVCNWVIGCKRSKATAAREFVRRLYDRGAWI